MIHIYKMPNCGNHTQNANYKKAGYPGIAFSLIGGGGGSSGGSGMNGGSSRSQDRFVLRNAWNGSAASGTYNSKKVAVTPFRAVNNAGDLLNRKNYVSGGSNQVKTGRLRTASVQSANILGGSIFSQPDNSNVPSATTNVKWVYDGSDYTKFKQQQAKNRNYNDYSNGGSNNGSFTAYNRVKH